jgi:Dolichyl-phosphate-mannose-protein mannosyltransferase
MILATRRATQRVRLGSAPDQLFKFGPTIVASVFENRHASRLGDAGYHCNVETQSKPAWTDFRQHLKIARNRLENAPLRPFFVKFALAGLVVFYLLITGVMATRQLWHDELFTYYIARSSTLGVLWQNIQLDLNPPLQYLAVRASLSLLGDNPYATRFPCILAFLAGSLCLYVCVARRLRPAYGLLAVLAFWTTPFFYYATEARPYGLVIGFFGMAMLAYQKAVKPERGTTAVWFLAASVAGMMGSHLFAILYLFPFGLSELVRLWRARKPDWPVWLALGVPCVFPFIYIPLVARFQGGMYPQVFQASLHRIPSFYFTAIKPEGPVLLLAICLGLLAAFRRERFKVAREALPTTGEVIFVAGIIATPAIAVLAVMRSHGAFFDRYGVLFGFALAFFIVFFIAAYTNMSRLGAMAAGAVLLLYIPAENALSQAAQMLHRKAPPSVGLAAIEPNLPLVAASGLTFLEMDKYADAGTRARLHYLTDTQFAIRYAHANLFESMALLKSHFPIGAAVDPYRTFVQQHRTFLVLGAPAYPEDWLLRKLLADGDELRYLGDFSGPYRDSQLYRVTIAAP